MTADQRAQLRTLVSERRRAIVAAANECRCELCAGSRVVTKARHDTEYAYKNFRCRCNDCRKGAADVRAARRRAERGRVTA